MLLGESEATQLLLVCSMIMTTIKINFCIRSRAVESWSFCLGWQRKPCGETQHHSGRSERDCFVTAVMRHPETSWTKDVAGPLFLSSADGRGSDCFCRVSHATTQYDTEQWHMLIWPHRIETDC